MEREKTRGLGDPLIWSDKMRIEVWKVLAVALVLGLAVAGNVNGSGAQRQSNVDVMAPVVAVRGEAARDEKTREAATQRALAQAVAATEARRSVVGQKSGGETRPEATELALTGPAGGVRLSVRGQLASGFVYRRAEAERPGEAACGDVAAHAAAANDDSSGAEPGEVRP